MLRCDIFVNILLTFLTLILSLKFIAGSSEGRLDNFKVNLKDGETTSLCSEYPFEVAEIGHGMRVNCAADVGLQDKVQIESHFKADMDVAELEVHTLGTWIYFAFLCIFVDNNFLLYISWLKLQDCLTRDMFYFIEDALKALIAT